MKYIYLILLLSSLSFGQDINHFSFNDLYDFNVNTVFDINESSDHVMWFGTSEGLVSFDGVSFKKFVNEHFAIAYTNVKIDKKGRIWCSNFGGQLFYLEEDSLKLAVNWSTNGDFITDYSITKLPEIIILGSGAGEINKCILGSNNKDVLFKSNHHKLFTLPFKDKLQFAIHENSDESSEGQLKIFKPETFPGDGQVEEVYNITIPSGKWSLFGDSKNLFINTFNKTGQIQQLINNQTKTILSEIDLSTYRFNAIDFINDKIWILSKKGVTIYDRTGRIYIKEGLNGVSASNLYRDHEGNIWVGTLNRGIMIIPSLTFNSLEVSQHSIANSTCDKNGNLYILDDQGNLFKSLPPYDRIHPLNNQDQLEPSPLFFDDFKDRLYLGSFNKYYDTHDKRVVKRSLNDGYSALMFKNSSYIGNGYYVNTNYTNAYIHSDINDIKSAPLNFGHKRSIIRPFRSKHIQATADLSGLYIDYIDGLYYYDLKESPIDVLRENRQIQTAAFQKDLVKENRIWVATKSQELLAIEQGAIVENIKLPMIARKIALTKEYIFLASLNGIYRFDRAAQELEIIDETDGWIKGRTTSLLVEGNHCIVVGDRYIQRFPVDYSTKNNVKPKVFITSMKVEDRQYSFSNDNTLASGSNFISFDFRALSVRSQKELVYQYRLSTESADWITTSSDNPEARFFNLNAGNYSFEVRACNESNICSASKTINFTIENPFYKKWWFIGLAFLSVVLIFFLIMRARFEIKERQERLKLEQQRLKKEAYKSKIAAIRSQMNPHFMFNALNTIQEFILTNQQEIASEYLADFADLMRVYLDQSREDNVSISTEVETLMLYLRLENLRFNEGLNYEVNVDPLINKDGTQIPVMLLQPYVENSIKHGLLHKKGRKNLTISFTQTDDKGIKCVVLDNGIGRASSTKINESKSIGHKSFATGANESRVELINQNRDKKIKVNIIDLYDDERPSGTRVEIYIN